MNTPKSFADYLAEIETHNTQEPWTCYRATGLGIVERHETTTWGKGTDFDSVITSRPYVIAEE